MKKFYVYEAYGKDEELLYIGKGSGDRYKHCCSGRSSNVELNRYFFENGEGSCITVKISHWFDEESKAVEVENDLIHKKQPLFNKENLPKQKDYLKSTLTLEQQIGLGYTVDFSRILRKYIKALEEGDKDVVEWIERVSEVHKQLVTVLGIDKVKSIGMNKTKLMNSYNLTVKFSEENVNIKAKLTQFRVGGRYTSQQIVSKLQEAYNECGIDRKAVSNDIKNYFSVMKTQVVSPEDSKRKQGFVILSDIYKEEV